MIRRRAKNKPAPLAKKRTRKKRRPAPSLPAGELAATPTETSDEAVVGIARDAVVILRKELAWRADLSLRRPGSVSMSDCIALLRLTADLAAAAKQGENDLAQAADYSRLSPAERMQLAALQLKVNYG